MEQYLDGVPVEEAIVILCNGTLLDTSMQLRNVKQMFWTFDDQRLLTLNYRRKDTIRVDTPGFQCIRKDKLRKGPQVTGQRPSANQSFALIRNSQSLSKKPTALVKSTQYQPRKPPSWIPDHLAFNCTQCDNELNSGSFSSKKLEHCRNCGKCFCRQCCNNFVPIPEFGYFEPTRVCYLCRQSLERCAEEQKT